MVNLAKTGKTKSSQLRNMAILAIVVLVGVIAMCFMLSDQSVTSNSKEDKPVFASALNRIDAESIVLEKTQKELHETKKTAQNLEEKFDSMNNSRKLEDESRQKTNEELVKRVESLEKQLSTSGASFQATSNQMQGSETYQGNVLPAQPGNGNPNINYNTGRGIREDSLSLTKSEELSHQSPIKNPDTYVPAGSFVTAVMLSGADASAAVNSQSNPEPMVFRLTANGTMPNHKKSHLKNCFVTAAVIGDISSERGKLRLERLSCTFPNGETVEQEVEGTVSGPDGKNGVRGTPLWRDGAITQRMFAAGFLSGVANGVSNSYNTNSISAQGTVQTLNSSKIFQNGLASGSAKSMDKLSDYYIQRAEQYHPVIQLSAGTVVDVVFLKGFFLDGKKHENPDTSLGNYSNHTINTSNFFPAQPSEAQTLPLSEESVRRIQEKSKELGYRVTPTPATNPS